MGQPRNGEFCLIGHAAPRQKEKCNRVDRVPLISSNIYREVGYINNHPLAIDRIGPVIDLCKHHGWLETGEDDKIISSPVADFNTLLKFHDESYLSALFEAAASGVVTSKVRQHHNIGTMENPWFEGLIERACTSVGGSILSSKLADQYGLAYHPAGGTHHGKKSKASGFCYFNDPVFAILTFLELGYENCFYIDLDAHHGDGVETAFEDNDQVFSFSIHEENRWPYSGAMGFSPTGNALNIPVPKHTNDTEFELIIRRVLMPLLDRSKPDCLVITCGADPLDGDPLSSMSLSNGALWNAVTDILTAGVPTTILGGGGYNPWTVARCWAGLYGVINGFEIPERMPDCSRKLMRGLSCDLIDDEDIKPSWLETLADPPNQGTVRSEFLRFDELLTAMPRRRMITSRDKVLEN